MPVREDLDKGLQVRPSGRPSLARGSPAGRKGGRMMRLTNARVRLLEVRVGVAVRRLLARTVTTRATGTQIARSDLSVSITRQPHHTIQVEAGVRNVRGTLSHTVSTLAVWPDLDVEKVAKVLACQYAEKGAA